MLAALLLAVVAAVNGATADAVAPTMCELPVVETKACIPRPNSPWEWASCDDYELDNALETAVKSGDHSAVELLVQRHDLAYTYNERRRIAGILLNHVADDSKYWKELVTPAEHAL